MKIKEIRELEIEQIQQQLEASREEQFKLRLAWYGNTLEDATQLRKVRKDIARMLTVLRERELAAELVQGEDSNAQ
jgi:large subunit ribosomal protein L29